MNKTDLIQAVALREQIKPEDAEHVFDSFLEVISLSLACEEDVTIRNFGRFEHRKRNAVRRRNPRTGDPVDVPSRNSVGFRPAPRLRERVNGKR